MPVLADIRAAWARPRGFIAGKLAEGPREDRALAVLMGASGLSFVAQWPRLARAAHLDPSVGLDARMAGALMATVFILPLVAYGIAAVAHLAARVAGGRGSFFGARLALFWAMLAIAPAMLFLGLLSGLAGPGQGTSAAGLAVFLGFLYLWGAMLYQTEWGVARWT
ncbi:MAG TPA: YIP1 family protein [Paracoccaceae bacterium]|nr:YIP1 family protein [Paracoccaceae bacterium]HMO71646.1 YIP1 family protein [Paracoccaceae bacterium]